MWGGKRGVSVKEDFLGVVTESFEPKGRVPLHDLR